MSTATQWVIDPMHTDVLFSVRHLGISTIRGKFNTVNGTAMFDPANLSEIDLNITIDAASFDTGNDHRDGHVKSADFLDVAQFPTITFVGKSITSKGEGVHDLAGEFTLHGVTKPVILHVEGPSEPVIAPNTDKPRVGASATTTINRKDFGLTFHAVAETGALLVGDEIKVTLEVQFVQA